jgi:hypothetical protein
MCNQNNNNEELKHETRKSYQVPIKQNYFQHQDIQYIQEEGLAMGTPTSYIFSKIYLQYLENIKILDILLKSHTIGYFCYVDDSLIIYKNGITNIHDVLSIFNNITPTMKFTMEEENDDKTNFLDITISKEDKNKSFSIYRKTSTTDTIIQVTHITPQNTNLPQLDI